jgi:hypothetical protein
MAAALRRARGSKRETLVWGGGNVSLGDETSIG